MFLGIKKELKLLPFCNVHGEWISICNGKQCNCSICGKGYDHTYEFIEEWNFCPNCGADMRKDKIYVGDEVLHTTGDGVRGVIIKIHDDIHNDNCFDILDSDGDFYEYASMRCWKKTGRHFDEVAELLDKMRGEE